MTRSRIFAGLAPLFVVLTLDTLESRADDPAPPIPAEKNLLLLHNGGAVVGIIPQVGGRVMLYRTDKGANVLNASPELWDTTTPEDKATLVQKSYHGESTWSGPQADWWTEREPYPPVPNPHPVKNPGGDPWPPDPAFEMAPYTVLEKSDTSATLRGPVSKLTGLELTKKMELLGDGSFKLTVTAVNKGEKTVSDRDLWIVVRPPPTTTLCFLPINFRSAQDGFTSAVTRKEVGGLTTLELAPHAADAPFAGGKMRANATADWIAAALPGCFFVINFHPSDPAKTVKGQAPVEVYYASEPKPLCELELHSEAHTLKPGESMTWGEIWQIVPYTGATDPETEGKFLKLNPALIHNMRNHRQQGPD